MMRSEDVIRGWSRRISAKHDAIYNQVKNRQMPPQAAQDVARWLACAEGTRPAATVGESTGIQGPGGVGQDARA